MFLINPLTYMLQLDIFTYLFGAFAFFGVALLLQYLILNRGTIGK